MASRPDATATPPQPMRHTTWKALIGGLIAYALVKVAAIGVVTGVGPSDVMAMPDLFLPAMTSRGLSEIFGAGLILTLVVGFMRISPRSGFLMVALVQAAVGWFAPMEWKDGWMRWIFGATGLDDVWAQAGLSPPFQQHSMLGGLSVQDLLVCGAAAAVGQTVHNMTVNQAARDAAKTP